MKLIRTTLLSLALLLGVAGTAMAADLGSLKDTPDGDENEEATARWYLRGDIGYNFLVNPSQDADGSIVTPAAGSIDLTNTSISNTFAFGGGAGYYLSRHWRTDLTYMWDPDSRVHGFWAISPTLAADGFRTNRNFHIQSSVLLANVYYDFDNWHDITPYLGAGVGVSWNVTRDAFAFDGGGCACFAGTPIGGTTPNFAWDVAAGFTHEIDRGVSLDVGYELIDLGKARISDFTTNCLSCKGFQGPLNNPGTNVDTIWDNQIRVGIRYDIW
jgi:opacity protein-like surface antigen